VSVQEKEGCGDWEILFIAIFVVRVLEFQTSTFYSISAGYTL